MFKINSYQNNLKTNISHLRSNNVKYNDSMIHNMKIHNYINTLFNSISNNTNNLSKNILNDFYFYISNFLINELNILNREKIQLAFYNIFFERIFFFKNNKIIPNYECSFEFIYYFGTDEIKNTKIVHLLKEYDINENPYYVGLDHPFFSKLHTKIVSLFKNVNRNRKIGGTKEVLKNNYKRANTLHNFNTSRIEQRVREIIKNTIKNNRHSNSFINNSASSSSIENKFLNKIKEEINLNYKHIFMILDFNEIESFYNLIIKYYIDKLEPFKIIFINDAN